MAGKTKALIDELIALRTRGRGGSSHFVRVHLALQGIDPDQHTESTEDDEATTAKLVEMIAQFKRST